jgi:nitroreductase
MSETEILNALEWRYACKSFDPARKISADTWATLEKSLVLTPSSFGMQPWKFFVVEDAALRESLVPHAWNQRQVADASHLLVMAAHRAMPESHIDTNLARMVEVRGTTVESLAGYRAVVAGFRQKGEEQGWLGSWAKQQAYIALGQFMLAAALLRIDTCPMEGFVPEKFDGVLGLTGTEFTSVVLCPAGYRAADDKYAALPKVRFPLADVVGRLPVT